jgi:hypothetical protein
MAPAFKPCLTVLVFIPHKPTNKARQHDTLVLEKIKENSKF